MKIVKHDSPLEGNIEEVVNENIKYDPSKRYTWSKEDVFYLTGEDFGKLLNALRSILNTQEAQTILLADKANQAIETSIAAAVEAGIVKEVNE